jgi:DNA end-binding protein Ku
LLYRVVPSTDAKGDFMPLRSSWEGFLRLNLISVPIKGYSAGVSGGGKIGFHQLHAKCHSRIRYKKICPIHGEVSNDEIVPGYEYARGQYIVMDPKELAKLRPAADKTINIEVFIHPDALDPMYFTDRTYYLVPDGKVGQKPYQVLHKVMSEENRYAVATMVFSGREQTVAVRAVGKLLVVTVLSYAAQFKKPGTLEDEIQDTGLSAEEIKLARTPIEGVTAEDFDFSQYEDHYHEEVTKLIQRKAAGKKIVATTKHDEPVVINLMDALRQSLAAAKHGRHQEGKSAKRHPIAGKTHTARSKRKTG